MKPKRVLFLANHRLSALEKAELHNLGIAIAKYGTTLYTSCIPLREGVLTGGGEVADGLPQQHYDARVYYKMPLPAKRDTATEYVELKDWNRLTRFTDDAWVGLYQAGIIT